MNVVEIEGIGKAYAAKLDKAGIRTTEALLKKGATPNGRKEIAAASGISHELIMEWVNHTDLMRVKGVAGEYSDLLEEAGVDTVVELSKRVAENLYNKLSEVNQAKNLVNKLPGPKQVKNWIEQAKKLPRVVTY
jgi:predicted flap endonuclease-1-like 5' DNA nuclease